MRSGSRFAGCNGPTEFLTLAALEETIVPGHLAAVLTNLADVGLNLDRGHWNVGTDCRHWCGLLLTNWSGGLCQ